MKNAIKKALTRGAIAAAIGLLLGYLFLALRIDPMQLGALPAKERWLLLSDSMAVPGVMLTAFGLLMGVSRRGAMDGVGWLVMNALRSLFPVAGAKMESYEDYLSNRRKNRTRGWLFLPVTGMVFLLAAVVFMLLFYRAG